MNEANHSEGLERHEPAEAITRNQIPGLIAKITGRRPSPSSAYRLIRDGKIPAFRLAEGGQIYARREDVVAYARRQLAAGMSPRGREAAAAVERLKSRAHDAPSSKSGGEE
jgi:hypothetical protein